MPEITGVNRHLGCAVVDHETYIWVTRWLDDEGDECEAPEAVACIAGDDENGWWSIDLTAFIETRLN